MNSIHGHSVESAREIFSSIWLESSPRNSGNYAGAITGMVDLGSVDEPRFISSQNVLDLLVDISTVLDENARRRGTRQRDRYVFLPSWTCSLIEKDVLDGDIQLNGFVQKMHIKNLERFTVYCTDHLNQAGPGKWVVIFGLNKGVVFNGDGYKVVNQEEIGHAIIKSYGS